jgi:hypothetical protein
MILKLIVKMKGYSLKEIELKSNTNKQNINKNSLNHIDLTMGTINFYQIDLN